MADDERKEELSSIQAIYPELDIFDDNTAARLELAIAPASPLLVRFVPANSVSSHSSQQCTPGNASNRNAHIEHDVYFTHLPPLCLEVRLPDGYPNDESPSISLSTAHDWLPRAKLAELETEATRLWEEYGRCQILFAYIDYLSQAAEDGFNLDQSTEGCLVLTADVIERELTQFDAEVKKKTFEIGTFDCGICLEPKKGTSCYSLERCGHVFCKSCLQDFYNDAIKEGNIVAVRCLDPNCGKDERGSSVSRKRKRELGRALHPRELLGMGVEEGVVRRYVELRRKKRLEADKTMVYCPRTWCQGPAKSPKYPPIPKDLTTYPASEDEHSDDEEGALPTPPASPHLLHAQPSRSAKNSENHPIDPNDRLSICEKCSLAFCRVCYMGWHGPFARCYPRDPTELSAEEKASYDYIRQHTSPCPTCFSPVQKTMGCNHMKCFQCNTHFCYLCGAWLDAQNPYAHFNKQGSDCYQRLWELEEGEHGNGDREGLQGGRGWMQIAIEAAREAEQAEEEANEAEMVEAIHRMQVVDRPPQPPLPQPMQRRRSDAAHQGAPVG